MFRLFFVFTVLLPAASLRGQEKDTVRRTPLENELSLLTGAGYSRHAFIDLGGSVNRAGTIGHHPFSSAYFISSELHFGSKPVVGPKVGAWAAGGAGGIAMGVSLIYYSDFEQGQLVFRPEIGLGLLKFKLTYGYNARLTNTGFDPVSRNIVGVTYCFRLKKL